MTSTPNAAARASPRHSTSTTSAILLPKVTETVLAALKARENPSRPLPRVLFIGDSITGTYWEGVQKNLDGKAFVAKNPGNGEHSGTGARMVDQWVDLKQYLLNGQEYLELIDGVKQTLADIDRYCPRLRRTHARTRRLRLVPGHRRRAVRRLRRRIMKRT